jgi:hypothetical protein
MEVQLTDAAQTQVDLGGAPAEAITQAATRLANPELPDGVVVLTRAERHTHGYVDDLDPDGNKSQDEDVWLITEGETKVFFTQFDQEGGDTVRLILRAL